MIRTDMPLALTNVIASTASPLAKAPKFSLLTRD